MQDQKQSCGSPDPLDITQDVLESRICDGIRDCNGGEDEDGSLYRYGDQCPESSEKTDGGCCKYMTIIMANLESPWTSIDEEDRYSCVANVNHTTK